MLPTIKFQKPLNKELYISGLSKVAGCRRKSPPTTLLGISLRMAFLCLVQGMWTLCESVGN